ncbi:hypothetical protein J3F84DRAFT_380522 [Trichoderma pleuroticola]
MPNHKARGQTRHDKGRKRAWKRTNTRGEKTLQPTDQPRVIAYPRARDRDKIRIFLHTYVAPVARQASCLGNSSNDEEKGLRRKRRQQTAWPCSQPRVALSVLFLRFPSLTQFCRVYTALLCFASSYKHSTGGHPLLNAFRKYHLAAHNEQLLVIHHPFTANPSFFFFSFFSFSVHLFQQFLLAYIHFCLLPSGLTLYLAGTLLLLLSSLPTRHMLCSAVSAS